MDKFSKKNNVQFSHIPNLLLLGPGYSSQDPAEHRLRDGGEDSLVQVRKPLFPRAALGQVSAREVKQ